MSVGGAICKNPDLECKAHRIDEGNLDRGHVRVSYNRGGLDTDYFRFVYNIRNPHEIGVRITKTTTTPLLNWSDNGATALNIQHLNTF